MGTTGIRKQAVLSSFIEQLMDIGVSLATTKPTQLGPDSIGSTEEENNDALEMITYSHESADIPDIIFDDRSSLVCIVDVFGSAASAPGLVPGLRLRRIAGKNVAGLPTELAMQRILLAQPKPVK